MKTHVTSLVSVLILAGCLPLAGQGTFQNLDFEDGIFIPIAGDPYGSVQFAAAMPGWTGYLGGVQVDRILHNNDFLGTAGMSIMGPDNPAADWLHGHYYVILRDSFPVPTATPTIAQTGLVPAGTQSIRFYSVSQFVITLGVSFNGNTIPLSLLGTTTNNQRIWGGDIAAFAGQNGELRIFGTGYLDYIRFSSVPIPEPSALSLLVVSAAAWFWRRRSIELP